MAPSPAKVGEFFMFKRVQNSYRFLSRRFLTQKRVSKITSFNLIALGLFAGFLLPQADTYAQNQTLKQLSTAQFQTVETATSPALQFPLKNYIIGQFFSIAHPGVDLDASFGTPIYPVSTGTVKQVERWSWGYGNHLILDHGNGFGSLYAHLSKIEVKVGDEVKNDTVIGKVGSTGWSTGNHLHLEIYEKDRALNPLEVLSEREN